MYLFRNLVQRQEELFGLGERGRSLESHLHAEGWRHGSGVQEVLRGTHQVRGSHEGKGREVHA